MSPKAQESAPATMEQKLLSSLQVVPAGRVSFSVTPFAVPTPMFWTRIVNAAWSPALMVPLSAVFRTVMFGQLTVTLAVAFGTGVGRFVPVTDAVLLTSPQVSGVVG